MVCAVFRISAMRQFDVKSTSSQTRWDFHNIYCFLERTFVVKNQYVI